MRSSSSCRTWRSCFIPNRRDIGVRAFGAFRRKHLSLIDETPCLSSGKLHKIPLADHESHPPIPATNPQFPFARRSDVNAGRADRSAGAGKVRIIVADQHPIVRNGLRSFLLARHPHLAVIAEAGDGLEAWPSQEVFCRCPPA